MSFALIAPRFKQVTFLLEKDGLIIDYRKGLLDINLIATAVPHFLEATSAVSKQLSFSEDGSVTRIVLNLAQHSKLEIMDQLGDRILILEKPQDLIE